MVYHCLAMQRESFENIRSAQQRMEDDRAVDLIVCKRDTSVLWELVERRDLDGQSWCICYWSNRRAAMRRLSVLNAAVLNNLKQHTI